MGNTASTNNELCNFNPPNSCHDLSYDSNQLYVHPNDAILAKILHFGAKDIKYIIPKYELGDVNMKVIIPETTIEEFEVNEKMFPLTVDKALQALQFNFNKEKKEWWMEKATSFWHRMLDIYNTCFVEPTKGAAPNNAFTQSVNLPSCKQYLAFLIKEKSHLIHIHHREDRQDYPDEYKICIPEITNDNYKNFIYHNIDNRYKIESKLKEYGFKKYNNHNEWEIIMPYIDYHYLMRNYQADIETTANKQ